jgi:hypothetical protein
MDKDLAPPIGSNSSGNSMPTPVGSNRNSTTRDALLMERPDQFIGPSFAFGHAAAITVGITHGAFGQMC